MLARLSNRLTYANVVSTLCLFIALGGTSVAAVALKRNSVKGKHIAPNAISSPKVKDASLLARDFAPGQLPEGARGPQGERGSQGVPGADGQAGAPGTAAAYAHINADGTFDPARSKGVVRTRRAGPGAYCIEFDVEPRNVVSTVHQGSIAVYTSSVVTKFDVINNGPPCAQPPTHNVQVLVFNGSNNSADQPVEVIVN